jgi:hypothetical protein
VCVLPGYARVCPLSSTASSSLACSGLWRNLRRKSEVTAASCSSAPRWCPPGPAARLPAWLPGYLAGQDAEVIACDALIVPVVTGPRLRRAVIRRDKHCAWPASCDRPAAVSNVHHITRKKDGVPTSVKDCLLLCNYTTTSTSTGGDGKSNSYPTDPSAPPDPEARSSKATPPTIPTR